MVCSIESPVYTGLGIKLTNIYEFLSSANVEMGHVEKQFTPPEDIQEMRAKGLPWVVATCLLVIIALSAIIFYYVIAAELSAELTPSTAAPSIGYEVEFLETSKPPTTDFPTTEPTAILEEERIFATGAPPLKSNSRKFHHAAVTCRNEFCAEIGRDILIRDGNAVDAAIATVICMGAVHPHATGFGGGLIMVVHDRASNETVAINSPSIAPRSAREETFLVNPNLAKLGYSSIGTPGFLHGLWTAYKRFGSGRVAWQDLLLPTVNLLERGYPASAEYIAAVRSRLNEISSEKSMNGAYTTVAEGTVLRESVHLHFLRRIATASEPLELFYRGEIANQIIHEMKQRGGLLTKADLAGYESKIEPPQSVSLSNGYTIKGPTSPSAFPVIALIIDMVVGSYHNRSDISVDVDYLKDLLDAQRLGLVELEQIGDPVFAIPDPVIETLEERRNNSSNGSGEEDDSLSIDINGLLWKLSQEDYVGSHVNVIDSGHMAVSLSSTINEKFGSVRRFEKGGFVWNNAMSGFTVFDREDSEDVHVNSVEGRKRPRTSMAPLMLFDQEGQLIGCYGITGSLNSILALAQVILHRILFDMESVRSIDAPRIFAASEGATFESGFPLSILSELGATMSLDPMLSMDSVVHALEQSRNGTLQATCDFRDNMDQCARGF
ncbi:unnamed protein product [Cylicocyclus nassatus]|uniref:Gamma-glutamyltransferase n=1 Tax=Cylicocyclus nassatus TaxID=53992 RepID=A0AA36DJU9_CYLNA|nr:unnamed protein product [Cylicocyclus nassatus]